MAKIIGLTGGIGSGKTTVAKLFLQMGVPVYIADERARDLMSTPELQQKIAAEFGSEIVSGGIIDRKKLAGIVFNDPEKLQRLNAIVHPAVTTDFENWVAENQSHPFVIKEAAILFESGSFRQCDAIITVTAPEDVQIERVMKRDNVKKQEVLNRMKNQWTDEEKIKRSDFVIQNLEFNNIRVQMEEILKKLQNI